MGSFPILQGPHRGALFIAGGGFLLELKHGLAAITQPFAGCRTFYDYAQRFQEIDATVMLGLYLWLAILAVSAASLFLGLKGVFSRCRQFLSAGSRARVEKSTRRRRGNVEGPKPTGEHEA